MSKAESSFQLANRVAVVTGASSGIGRAIAITLAGQGMRLALLARREERLRGLATELGEDRTLVLPTDMRDLAAIEKAFAEVRETWGGTDVLINNAGLGRAASLIDGAEAAWREMLEVNVLALSVCTKHALRDMVAKGQGHIVHIASMASHRVPLGSGMYAASKFAVRALTEALRAELRSQQSPIRVCAISPGFVETEFAEIYNGSAEAATRTYGRYKVLQPEDIADTVLHVLKAPPHVQIHDVLMRPTDQPN